MVGNSAKNPLGVVMTSPNMPRSLIVSATVSVVRRDLVCLDPQSLLKNGSSPKVGVDSRCFGW